MEEQVSQALSRVKFILSDVKLSITSVPSEKFLPIISDILSEIIEVVACVQQVDAMSVDEPDDDLWWDSSPECVNYSDSDEEHLMVSTIPFSSVSNGSLSSLSSKSSDDQTKDFINKILSCISIAAPGDVFSRRKYERKRDKLLKSLVHHELFSLWQHSTQLYDDYKVEYVKPAPLFPTINLRDVNVRALANIPKPQLVPVSGCSIDPAHYDKIHSPITNTGYQRDSISFGPIGYLYGYETIHGVVPVPDHPIHGYIWNHVQGNWILHSDVSTKDPGRGRSTSRNQRG